MAWATLDTTGSDPVLRFERRLAHAPEKVFRAISEPAELRHWFPATVELELRTGAPIRFRFEEHGIDAPGGEVLELDPPRLLAYTWGRDVLRWEIVPEGDGCRLLFTQTLGEGGLSGGLPGTARNAAGWDVCLAGLAARLDGAPAPDTAWFPLFEAYADRFGLGEAHVRETGDGVVARFVRDVVASSPAEVWATLCEGSEPEVGAVAPRRFAPTPPGAVTGLEPERALALDGVRWTLEPREFGALIVVEVTLPEPDPAALAAWQVHLELLVAALAGEVRPWPQDRVDALADRYAALAT
jgi:uncharacterized protein YndB with AHSA1/START domain